MYRYLNCGYNLDERTKLNNDNNARNAYFAVTTSKASNK